MLEMEELLKQISLGEDSRIELKSLEYSENTVTGQHSKYNDDRKSFLAAIFQKRIVKLPFGPVSDEF
jgi:hypothetical protein